eukprot:3046864-Rhodomonas_salina.1
MACGFYQVMSAHNKPSLRAALLTISSTLQDTQECFDAEVIEFVIFSSLHFEIFGRTLHFVGTPKDLHFVEFFNH